MHDLMSIAGHLAQAWLCFEPDESVPVDNGCGSMGRQRGNREKTENSTGKSSTGKSSGSRRWFIIMAALVLMVAVVSAGGLWWHHHSVQEHYRAFSSDKAASKTYKVRVSECRKCLASDEMKSASAVRDDQVSDAKTVLTLAKSVQTVKLASGRTTGAKTNLIGDASTSELKKVVEALNTQISEMRSRLKVLKANMYLLSSLPKRISCSLMPSGTGKRSGLLRRQSA